MYWTYFKREFGKKGVNIGVLAGFVLLLSGIKSCEKIYELRLYDEKRQKIKRGDYIVFTAENGERLTAKVTDILRFNDFAELYAALPKTKIGYKPHEIADPEDMAQYYAEDEIKKYGVVALKIELANRR